MDAEYAERLGHFLTANGITDGDKKRAVFLSVICPKAYKLLGNLIAPAKPGEKWYEELVEVMMQHHNPPPSEIVQKYKFHTMKRHKTLGRNSSLMPTTTPLEAKDHTAVKYFAHYLS